MKINISTQGLQQNIISLWPYWRMRNRTSSATWLIPTLWKSINNCKSSPFLFGIKSFFATVNYFCHPFRKMKSWLCKQNTKCLFRFFRWQYGSANWATGGRWLCRLFHYSINSLESKLFILVNEKTSVLWQRIQSEYLFFWFLSVGRWISLEHWRWYGTR